MCVCVCVCVWGGGGEAHTCIHVAMYKNREGTVYIGETEGLKQNCTGEGKSAVMERERERGGGGGQD